MSPDTPHVVRASEIGHYVFCRRAWWLATVRGYRPANSAVLTDGVQAHARHGQRVAAGQLWQRVGYGLLGLAGILAIFVCYLWLGG